MTPGKVSKIGGKRHERKRNNNSNFSEIKIKLNINNKVSKIIIKLNNNN